MRFLDEYRDREVTRSLVAAIEQTQTRPWTLMEVCGGQTHTIVKFGIDRLLPEAVELVHGPGCPVCVTPLEQIDRAHAIAARAGVVFTSFGDMLRVPGTDGDLLELKARGSDVRVVYTPLDAVAIAESNPDREVVFFAIGFETTAPANAVAVQQAERRGLENFSVLVSHVLVPPALCHVLESPGNRVQGFLGPGHVCTVMGTEEYEPISDRYHVPIEITGFEPVDMLEGILRCVEQLEAGRAEVRTPYRRVVRREGNLAAKSVVREVFDVCDRKWRGLGEIPKSGYRLRNAYRFFDAEERFDVGRITTRESTVCLSGEILKGVRKPVDCPAFGNECTPQTPLGATMVSAEGACAAYFAYGRHLERPAAEEVT
jgi:hydrogenase expression/formation protein HypD